MRVRTVSMMRRSIARQRAAGTLEQGQQAKAKKAQQGQKGKKKAAANKFNPNAPYFAGPAFEAPEVGDNDLLDGDTATNALAALRELAAKPDQPFFLAVGFANPHVPWVAPKKYWDLYNEAELKLPDNQYLPHNAPVYAAKSGADFYLYSNIPKDRNLSEPFKRQCLHGYLSAIDQLHRRAGRAPAGRGRRTQADSSYCVDWFASSAWATLNLSLASFRCISSASTRLGR